jgi:hypothetical protein
LGGGGDERKTGYKSKRHKKTEIGREGVKRVIIVKKKIANRKDKKAMKKGTGKRVWKGKNLHKKSEEEKQKKGKR